MLYSGHPTFHKPCFDGVHWTSGHRPSVRWGTLGVRVLALYGGRHAVTLQTPTNNVSSPTDSVGCYRWSSGYQRNFCPECFHLPFVKPSPDYGCLSSLLVSETLLDCFKSTDGPFESYGSPRTFSTLRYVCLRSHRVSEGTVSFFFLFLSQLQHPLHLPKYLTPTGP